MKKLFICTMLFVFGLAGMSYAVPMYYTYEGTLVTITTTPGGSPTYITDQGINPGDNFTWVFLIDFDRPGEKTRNNGETYAAGDFYADLIYHSPYFEALNVEYDDDPNRTAEYNYGWVTQYSSGWRSDVYVGPGGSYSHLDNYGILPISIYDWEVGQVCEVVFTVVDYLALESAAGYTTGILTSISDTNPLPGPTPVSIDIKPSSCPNPLNVKSKGVLPVAVLGTEELDVTTIDPASIRLAGVAPIRSNIEDVGTPVIGPIDPCDCTTEAIDGFLDLTLKFNTQEIVSILGEVADGDELVLTLTGETYGGTQIAGQDCVLILKKGRGRHKS